MNLAFLACVVLAQAAPSQQQVDTAVQRGVDFLKTLNVTTTAKIPERDHDLLLLALIHGGAPESDPKVQELLGMVLPRELLMTYNASVRAMALRELNASKYQLKIYECAQFLVDNQMPNGRWGYGTASPFAKQPPSADAKPLQVRVLRPVTKRSGDNSNSQYAALGLRACHEAGIGIPQDVLEKARQSWIFTQHPASSGGRGWCYHEGDLVCDHKGPAYGSMTAGGVSALCIYDYLLGMDPRKDTAVQEGIAWMEQNWSVTENRPRPEVGGDQQTPKQYLSYYLYALERVGMLYGTSQIGTHDWYAEGARAILDRQQKNGSWKGLSDEFSVHRDTAFAILFLKRATRPMVASVDPFKKR